MADHPNYTPDIITAWNLSSSTNPNLNLNIRKIERGLKHFNCCKETYRFKHLYVQPSMHRYDAEPTVNSTDASLNWSETSEVCSQDLDTFLRGLQLEFWQMPLWLSYFQKQYELKGFLRCRQTVFRVHLRIAVCALLPTVVSLVASTVSAWFLDCTFFKTI